jgi:single-strand DNA-binding protein
MASFNKITIVGYLGRDPEIRYTPQGDAFCSFSVATTERRKDQAGEHQDNTTWFRVTAWRRLAEISNQYLTKGKQVYVEGKLRLSEYTDRDGNRRQTLEVTASDIQFLGTKGEDGGAAAGGTTSGSTFNKPAARPQPASDPDEPPMVGDDEIPF